MTDKAILETLTASAPAQIIWKPQVFLPFHPNGMRFKSLDEDGKVTDEWTVYSVGGGTLAEEGVSSIDTPEIYPMNTMTVTTALEAFYNKYGVLTNFRIQVLEQ